MVKHLPAMRETRVQSLGWEDLLEKGMATYSSTLAWRIPQSEEPGRARRASFTNSWSSLRLTSIESVMPSSPLILCRPLLLLPPIPPSIRVFSNESTVRMRWPKYRSFSFNIIPSKEIPVEMLLTIWKTWQEGVRSTGCLCPCSPTTYNLFTNVASDVRATSSLWLTLGYAVACFHMDLFLLPHFSSSLCGAKSLRPRI